MFKNYDNNPASAAYIPTKPEGVTWEDFGMNIAKAAVIKSKDPSSQVGCYITNERHHPVSMGFNGMVAGADETFMSYERPLKYNLIIHAEMNALIFASTKDLRNHKAYVTHGPCDNCLKHLLQAGLRDIWYDCPGIMRDRGTSEQKEAITRLIKSTDAKVININNGIDYATELGAI